MRAWCDATQSISEASPRIARKPHRDKHLRTSPSDEGSLRRHRNGTYRRLGLEIPHRMESLVAPQWRRREVRSSSVDTKRPAREFYRPCLFEDVLPRRWNRI